MFDIVYSIPHLSVPGHLCFNAKKVPMSEQQTIPHSEGLYSADEEGNNSRTPEGHTTPVSNVHMPSVCKKKVE